MGKDFLARTQMKTAAKKKKAAKKPKKKKRKKKKKKAKKKKRRKKKKAKKVIYGKGGRKKGAHKSKGFKASGKKRAAALKKAGKGIFKVKTLSADLAAITGRNKMNYPDTFKAVWAFIKKKGLSAKGRKLGAVGKVFGGGSMFKLPAAVCKHMK